ncbi:unnamed protein product [Musa acuminata subsp. malaccensis]|uniref:(wild Malaysian banana) hypothetical protein n=1 Tax=Musa acuminata subsp. malaccensis TaxID=214687 RepID=A0A8D7A2M5_MUSAM|nr:unnamed protein product [Musa acuminata subsp. malaccensis]
MATRVPLAFLCFMLFASPLIAAKTFDFYYLVLMWPGAYCVQSACCRPTTGLPKNDFFVRGLWPFDSTTGKPVTKCNSDPFDIDQLSSLNDDLNSYWANLKCPSNNGVVYWKKSWKTYGVCSPMNETEYFQAALDLRAKVDVLSLLDKKAGIKPSLLYIHGASDIEKAIAEGIGATPVIRCSKGLLGLFQLYEIYICVAKDGKTIIECPEKPRFTCSEEILFTPFDTNKLHNVPPAELPVSDE